MPATAEQLAILDDNHRATQAQNAAVVAALVLRYWQEQVDHRSLAATGASWIEQSLAAIVAGWKQSTLLSFAYVKAVRAVQVPDAPALVFPRLEVPSDLTRPPSVIAEPGLAVLRPNLEQIRKSLTYTGLVTAAQGLAKTPGDVDPEPEPVAGDSAGIEEAMRQARRSAEWTNRALEQRRLAVMQASAAKAAAAAVRHVQNGGRAGTMEVIRRDKVALGYVRITRPDCCYFCAMLASRGPVYEKDSFDESNAQFDDGKYPSDHKVHDSCGCAMRPVYTRSKTEWPEHSLSFEELWKATTKKVSGSKKVLKFRQAYEGRAA